jgi:hypothetical protein
MTSAKIRQIRDQIRTGKMVRRFGLRSMRSLPAFENGGYVAVSNRGTYAMWLYV